MEYKQEFCKMQINEVFDSSIQSNNKNSRIVFKYYDPQKNKDFVVKATIPRTMSDQFVKKQQSKKSFEYEFEEATW